MRKLIRRWVNRLAFALSPDVRGWAYDSEAVTHANRVLTYEAEAARERERLYRQDYFERLCMLAEAKLMAGSGPWMVSGKVLEQTEALLTAGAEALKKSEEASLRETVTPITAQGAFGDIELALQNVEWRREINLSWLEFSRWGIQQIILISRLFFIKNPMIQRGINIASYYVFGRGCEVISDDDDANDGLHDFFERNNSIIGHMGLMELEKRLFYDGQVFFVLFPDKTDKGSVNVRTIDATEIHEVITNPDDTDEPWFYRRLWTSRPVDMTSGQVATSPDKEAFYPALGYDPTNKPPTMNEKPIMWDSPVYHMKSGVGVSKWHFHTPRVYAAIDWAKNATRFLEACLTTRQSLAQFAMTLTTKGGQQAMEGAKQQTQTRINSQPGNALWDTNPTAVKASIFASGPGTELKAFNTRGAAADPEEVRQFKLMVCMVLDIPETFLCDMNTSNLATAQTLDRPTELGFIAKQEAWRQTLLVLAKYALGVSKGAANGVFSESRRKNLRIVEMRRILKPNGQYVYEAGPKKKNTIQLRVNFPAIREGDMPQLVKAITEAMTLDNKGGQVVGIDEKAGVRLLYEQLGVEDPEEILEEQYPEGEYDPDRTKEPLPAPIMKAMPNPGGQPQNPGGGQPPVQDAPMTPPPKESRRRLVRA